MMPKGQGWPTCITNPVLLYRALFNWSAPPAFVSSCIVTPCLQTLFFVLVSRQTGAADDRFYVTAGSLLALTNLCLSGAAMSVANERRYGTVEALLLSRHRFVTSLVLRLYPFLAVGVLTAGTVYVVTSLANGVALTAEDLLNFGLAASAAGVSLASLGLVLGLLMVTGRSVLVLINMTQAALLVLSGVLLPDDLLPGWMDICAWILPLAHSGRAMHAVDGTGGLIRLSALGGELLVAAGYLVLACLSLGWVDRYLRVHGSNA